MEKICIIVFGLNELGNIQNALAMHKCGLPLIYIDSGSSDGSLEILNLHGVPTLVTFFTNWPALRNDGINEATRRGYEYSLILDADEFVTKDQFDNLLGTSLLHDAYFVQFRYFFNGKEHFYAKHRPRIRLIKNDRTFFVGDTISEYAHSHLPPSKLPTKLLFITNSDTSPYHSMLIKQINRGSMHHEVALVASRESIHTIKSSLDRFLENKLLLRAFLIFFFNYVFRLGFLDGRSGFYYCFSQSFIFHFSRAAFYFFSMTHE